MSNIKFTATVLTNTGKKGVLKPDAAGNYEQCIGGLNIDNAMGARYVADKARKLFENDSDLMRRISSGNLRGEAGHPRRQQGWNDNQWLNRVSDIEEKNVCVYWRTIELDESYGRNNPQFGNPEMVGIIARFRPGGVRGDFLAKDLEDGETNVCFSIRSISEAYEQRGKTFYELQVINTWDYVNEPGLAPANKWQSPTLESLVDFPITKRLVEKAMESNSGNVTMESANQHLAQVAKVFTFDTGISKPVSIFKHW